MYIMYIFSFLSCGLKRFVYLRVGSNFMNDRNKNIQTSKNYKSSVDRCQD